MGGGGGLGEFHFLQGGEGSFPFFFAFAIDEEVGKDGEYPGFEGGSAFEGLGISDGAQAGFLGEIFCFDGVMAEAEGELVEVV